MTQDFYRKTLRTAREDLERFYRQREELERKIARLRQTIISLGALTKEDAKREKQKAHFKETKNLSEAIMNVIMASEVPLHPRDIQEALEDLGYDIGSSNPLASVWSVVRRLENRKWYGNPYLRWYRKPSTDGKRWGRGSKIGVWWGDQRPGKPWKVYEVKETPPQRKTKRGPVEEEE